MNKRYFFLVVVVSSLFIYVLLSRQHNDVGKISKDLPESAVAKKKMATINNDIYPVRNGAIRDIKLPDLKPEQSVDKSAGDILSEKEEIQLRLENKKLELELDDVASEFNKNLSNIAIRKKLKEKLKESSSNYKNTSLKLAKDQLAKEKNNP